MTEEEINGQLGVEQEPPEVKASEVDPTTSTTSSSTTTTTAAEPVAEAPESARFDIEVVSDAFPAKAHAVVSLPHGPCQIQQMTGISWELADSEGLTSGDSYLRGCFVHADVTIDEAQFGYDVSYINLLSARFIYQNGGPSIESSSTCIGELCIDSYGSGLGKIDSSGSPGEVGDEWTLATYNPAPGGWRDGEQPAEIGVLIEAYADDIAVSPSFIMVPLTAGFAASDAEIGSLLAAAPGN